MKALFLTLLMVMPLGACASSPSHGDVTVNGVTYSDEHWNGN